MDLLVTIILTSLPTAALLMWWFRGNFATVIVSALTPTCCLQSTTREEIRMMTQRDLSIWMASNPRVPFLLAKLVSCRFCMSAYFSVAATLVACNSMGSIPDKALVWAGSAFLATVLELRFLGNVQD